MKILKTLWWLFWPMLLMTTLVTLIGSLAVWLISLTGILPENFQTWKSTMWVWLITFGAFFIYGIYKAVTSTPKHYDHE